jgi:hypothetical protein
MRTDKSSKGEEEIMEESEVWSRRDAAYQKRERLSSTIVRNAKWELWKKFRGKRPGTASPFRTM